MRGRIEILMSGVNFGEVYALIIREQGPARAHNAVNELRRLPMSLVDASWHRCCDAAEIKVRYKLGYADAFAAALAVEHKATLVTSDSDFRKLGHDFPVLWLRH